MVVTLSPDNGKQVLELAEKLGIPPADVVKAAVATYLALGSPRLLWPGITERAENANQ